MASPSLSYKFSEMLETHAVHTYGQFLDENKEELEQLPPSLSAIEYYAFGAFDPFYGEFQTAALSSGGEVSPFKIQKIRFLIAITHSHLPCLGLALLQIRRPGEDMRSLYDVFKAIRADETDHVCTMQACLDENSVLVSPSLEKKVLLGTAIVAATAAILSGGDLAGTSNLLSMNPGDMMVDGGASGLELDAIVAGAAAVVSQVFGGGSEALLDAKEVAGSVEAIEDSSVIAQFLGEGFTAGLLASKLLSSRKTKKEESEENLSDEVDVDANDENLTTDG
jgi:ubiquinol oxidase